MKTVLTPSLIAIACFSAFASADIALSAQSNSASQLQLTVGQAATVNSSVTAGTSQQADAGQTAQQISSNVAASTSQAADVTGSVQQQILGTANQALQQEASASVAQSVSQAVSAEVTNTVRNSITLATGL